VIKFEVDGTKYQFNEGRLLGVEASAVKKNTGLTIVDFLNGIIGGDPDALIGMVFIAKKRAGEPVKWNELSETLEMFALVKSLSIVDDDAPPADDEPAAEPAAAPEENGTAAA
jgi:hypothetical protein